MKKDQKNKLDGIITDEKSRWIEDSELFDRNGAWLEKSSLIALKILRFLRTKNITQKELAEKILVSPQYINKMIKGRENLTLETICKIEKVLGSSLIEIPDFENLSDYTEIRRKGLHALIEALGEVEAEKFITLIVREQFDYPEWQKTLWENKTVDQLNEEALSYLKKKSES